MLNMTRWNPFAELNGLHRELDRVLGRYVDQESTEAGRSAWMPATEINSS